MLDKFLCCSYYLANRVSVLLKSVFLCKKDHMISLGRSQKIFSEGYINASLSIKGRVSVFKGVVIRTIILYAAFMRFYFKIHTLLP